MRLQNAYQILDAKRKLGETLERIVPHAALSTLDANESRRQEAEGRRQKGKS